MALNPTFASTPRLGYAQITSTSSTNTVNAVHIVSSVSTNFTGVAAGTRIREIRVHSGPSTIPGNTGKCKVYVSDGTVDRIVDSFAITNTADTLQAVLVYSNFVLPSTSHLLKFSVVTALSAGATLDITVYGEDLT